MRLIFFLSVIVIFSCSKVDEKKNNPNFIIFLVDDQGWSGTSLQMADDINTSKSLYIETPNIERLASKGMRFSRGYSSSPVCSPSRYSIQFAQSAARLKMIRVGMNTRHIDHNKSITIPKKLKEINPNYKTAHFGKWGIDADPSILGYDYNDGLNGNKEGDFVNDKTQWETTFSDDPKKIYSLSNKAIEFIEEHEKNGDPFFLQISHYAVHTNIISKIKTHNKYTSKNKIRKTDHPGFAAMNENLDDGLGIILDKLDELNLNDNTYVIYTSDNGSVPTIPARKYYKETINYPLSRGKWDAMEGGIRVPFIVSGPGIKKNSESKVPVVGYDLLPTIIDLAGSKIKNLDEIDGGSFKDILLGKNNNIKRSYPGIVFHVPYENKIALTRAHSSIIRDNLKLIKFRNNNEIKLFDIDKDVGEKINIKQKYPVISTELERLLDDFLIKFKSLKWQEGINWKNVDVRELDSFHK